MQKLTTPAGLMPRVTVTHTVLTPGFSNECQIDHCQKTAAEGVGIKLCVNHLRKAYAAYLIVTGMDGDIEYREPAKVRDVHTSTAMGTVYFARVEGLIKIGWSSNVSKRMRELRADALFHTFPGTRNDESAMHALFSAYLVKGREWFRPAPELMSYIQGLQSKAS
jgi:hypothetical protein